VVLIQLLCEKLNERFAPEENISILFPKREKAHVWARIPSRVMVGEG
jgi:hypothetical protein